MLFNFFRVSLSQYNHEMLGFSKLSKNMPNGVKLQYYHIFFHSILYQKINLSWFSFLSLSNCYSSKSCLTFLLFTSISLTYVLQGGLILIKLNLQICKFWKWLILDKQRHCKPLVVQGKFLILMSFLYIKNHTCSYCEAKYQNMLVCHHSGLLVLVLLSSQEIFFNHF